MSGLRDRLKLAIGVIIVAVVIAWVIATIQRRKAERDAEQQKTRAANIATFKAIVLTSRDPAVDPEAYAIECEAAEALNRASLPKGVLSKCATAHFALAQRCLAAQDLGCARNTLDHARAEGASGDAYEAFASDLQRRETMEARKSYAAALRNRFLDRGLDINVLISGANNEDITLSFALFNDVWARRIQQDGLLEELRTKGFKHVRLIDGYDYGVRWDLTNQ